MNIGELARRTGCSARSIRHYEKAGLLASSRRANGYRDFDADAVSQVIQVAHFIRQGFALVDISTFPPCMLREITAAICPRALELHLARLAELDQQLRTLSERRERLASALGANVRPVRAIK
ncbi:MerR family DNA-binding transcriptional regulator [Myxococcus sp. K38C18041901]|uniref:MerR family DNA-binding transcriptional regulator n=1 Tax=Myxococcus guangdongensis TaxID=2906760 RepID=UPI0020A81820|nr:MerR family DNA-binding transcriptional regulator [Myxococcus guangdongensis]MCP3063789.1 MerR family DNA-binding transcriptional regulator [Myxococcus guangdongensis]